MSTHVTLAEASTFLGVSKATLRNWDKAKKLTATRNPCNHYRMYNLDELIQLRDSFSGQKTASTYFPGTTRQLKQSLNKIQSILRDEMPNSNIITQFDEISKLLFLKLNTNIDIPLFYESGLFESESEDDFARKVQDLYAKSLRTQQGLRIPEGFERIQLSSSVLRKCLEELHDIDFSKLTCDAKGIAYEEILKGTFDKNANQQFFTPYQIVDFMVAAVKPFLKGTVCDPACGTGGFLIKAGAEISTEKTVGLEIDERLAWAAMLNLLSHGVTGFSVDCLKNGGSLGEESFAYFGTADIILTNPPFGSEYSDREILQHFSLGKGRTSRRRGILFIEQAFHLLKDDGVAAIIIDRSVLNSKLNTDVQQFIAEHFEIRAIIDLPETAFMPYASVLSSILILQKSRQVRNKTVFFARADKIGRKPNGEDDIIYHTNGIKELNSDFDAILTDWNNHLNGKTFQNESLCFVADVRANLQEKSGSRLDYAFHHPFRNESTKILSHSLYKLHALADLCTERNETFIPASDFYTDAILFTGLANIESYTGIASQTLTAAASIKSAVKRYESGDILFAKMRPNLRKVALMNFETGGYASSECIVLSVRKNKNGQFLIAPDLLALILRSDFVYGQIMSLVTGIGRPRINGKDIRAIQIPVPPDEIQKQALFVMQNANETAKKLKEKAAILKDEAETIARASVNNIIKLIAG